MSTRFLAVLALSLALVGVVVSGGGGSTSRAPTTVAADDLDRDGTFWLSLTPDLRDELVEKAKERFADAHPDGATKIVAVDTAGLVAEIDKQYANEAKRAQDIYSTYELANRKQALARFNDAMSQLEDLER